MFGEQDFGELDGVKLIAQEDNVLAAQKKRSMGFEPVSRALWAELARAADVVVDAGAYTGFYSLLAVRAGAKRVHAFEANPDIVPRLLANLALNEVGTVSVHPHALAEASGRRIPIYGKGGLTSSGSIFGEGQAGQTVIASASTLALDDLALPALSLMKLDVERAELSVLQGAEATIRRHRPHLLIELLDDVAAVDTLLTGWGYHGAPTDRDMFHYRP